MMVIARARSDLPCNFLSLTVDIEPRHACVQSKERERARIQAYHAGIFPYCELCGPCILRKSQQRGWKANGCAVFQNANYARGNELRDEAAYIQASSTVSKGHGVRVCALCLCKPG